MFRKSSEAEYQENAVGGIRHLFQLGPFEFHDTLDAEDRFRHFVREAPAGDEEEAVYEVDRESMYEFMARYLAGEYEKTEYDMERSPGHDALLDLLELAAARARSGETEFSLEELEQGETEVIDDPVDPDELDGR
ncbi:MAG TPA: hypothetical protein VGR37_19575 [Longimicrobiaceae bacterium]|nr:hypothetical protein [Longimicrobiaceae bacterium]